MSKDRLKRSARWNRAHHVNCSCWFCLHRGFAFGPNKPYLTERHGVQIGSVAFARGKDQ